MFCAVIMRFPRYQTQKVIMLVCRHGSSVKSVLHFPPEYQTGDKDSRHHFSGIPARAVVFLIRGKQAF
jgi:hypothetical protein